jgi:uncharacterized protein (DUF2267 family)
VDSTAFIDSVATRLGTSSEQATALTRATLTTLAERIDPGEARDLAARAIRRAGRRLARTDR